MCVFVLQLFDHKTFQKLVAEYKVFVRELYLYK